MTAIVNAADTECVLRRPLGEVFQLETVLGSVNDDLCPTLEGLLGVAAVVDGVLLQGRRGA